MSGYYDKDRFRVELEQAIDAEHTTTMLYSHLASIMRNGKVKNRFRGFSKNSENNKMLLSQRMQELGVKDFDITAKCSFCKLTPDSFSLLGAINIGYEITDAAIKFYKDLAGMARENEDRKLFRSIIKGKAKERDFLKNEKKFSSKKISRDEPASESYTPEVVYNLWK